MNFYWAAVDGKLAIDHNGHTATLTRVGEKNWRAEATRGKSKYSNCFNTRREAARWASDQIGLNVPVNLMTFAFLPATKAVSTPTASTRAAAGSPQGESPRATKKAPA